MATEKWPYDHCDKIVSICESATLADGIPRALARALRVCAAQSPVLTARAEAALEVLLQSVLVSRWPEVSWQFSRLTANGFPVEFVFSSTDDAIRYTTEIAGPEFAECDRLDLAERALSRLGAGRLPGNVRTLFTEIQRCGVLRYGVWIGARHSLSGDRYKIYLEVPGNSEVADRFVGRLIGSEPLAPGHQTTLQMIGFEPKSATVELYFQCKWLEPWEAGLLLRRAGLDGRQEEMLDLVEHARHGLRRLHFPGPDTGFSFSITPGVEQRVFSLIHHAGTLFGGDASIRKHTLSLAAMYGWQLGCYQVLSEPLAIEHRWITHHTMATFSVATNRPAAFHIGLRPPDPADFTCEQREN